MQPSDDEDFICVGSKPTVGISDDLLGVPHRRKRKRPRIPADLDEGPLQVVAILGSSQGPWAQTRVCPGSNENGLEYMMSVVFDKYSWPSDVWEPWLLWDEIGNGLYLLGMVVMHLWSKPSNDEPGDELSQSVCMRMMMQQYYKTQRRRDVSCFIEMPISAAAFLREPLLVMESAERPPATSQELSDVLAHHPNLIFHIAQADVALGTQLDNFERLDVDSLVRKWSAQFRIQGMNMEPIPWHLWGYLGSAMVLGLWTVDVLEVMARHHCPRRSRLGAPPDTVLRQWKKLHIGVLRLETFTRRACTVPSVPCSRAYLATSTSQSKVPKTQFVSVFPPAHIISALRVQRHLTSSAHLQANVDNVTHFTDPAHAKEIIAARTELGFPSHLALQRAKLKLTAACQWWAREQLKTSKNKLWITLNPDASPQGLEIFGVAEKIIRNAHRTECEWRYAPLCHLGQGHLGAVDKHMCLHHYLFLKAGPTGKGMLEFSGCIRGIFSDQGNERVMGKLKNNIKEYLSAGQLKEKPNAATVDQAANVLFFNALEGPGTQHIEDLILRTVLFRMPGYPTFLVFLFTTDAQLRLSLKMLVFFLLLILQKIFSFSSFFLLDTCLCICELQDFI